ARAWMMMQMLVAGGIGPLTDGERVADENNPRGYLELMKVKQLQQRNDWLHEGARPLGKTGVAAVAAPAAARTLSSARHGPRSRRDRLVATADARARRSAGR